MFAPLMHGAMKHAMGPRRELGIRTVFNILGPLTNPAGAKRQVIGVFSGELVETLARVLQLLGSERVIVVHGADRTDEITLTTTTRAAAADGAELASFTIDPREYGLDCCAAEALVARDAEHSLAIARSVLAAEPGPQTDVVVLNAAAALLVADVAKDLAEGIERAREALVSGRARRVLDQWVEVSERL
jgi:anthranilate phosphoribosyltransferase